MPVLTEESSTKGDTHMEQQNPQSLLTEASKNINS